MPIKRNDYMPKNQPFKHCKQLTYFHLEKEFSQNGNWHCFGTSYFNITRNYSVRPKTGDRRPKFPSNVKRF